MDGFSYINIFETKGIEYLAIIAFFLILIPFWILLNRQVKITRQIQKAIGILTASVLRIPQGVLHSNNHTWTHLEKSGIASVGLDDLLLHILGEIQIGSLLKPGAVIQQGDILASIHHNGKSLDLFSPISGEVISTNPLIGNTPSVLHEDPYGKGWICKIRPVNWMVETSSFHLAKEATRWSETELVRFKDFLSASMEKYAPEPSAVILQDGGELKDHILADLPNEVWMDFQTNFLSVRS
jgi:glycine cleavage system H protein